MAKAPQHFDHDAQFALDLQKALQASKEHSPKRSKELDQIVQPSQKEPSAPNLDGETKQDKETLQHKDISSLSRHEQISELKKLREQRKLDFKISYDQSKLQIQIYTNTKNSNLSHASRIEKLNELFIRLSDLLQKAKNEYKDTKAIAESLENNNAVAHFLEDANEKMNIIFDEITKLEELTKKVKSGIDSLDTQSIEFDNKMWNDRFEELTKKSRELDAEFEKLGLKKAHLSCYRDTNDAYIYLTADDYNKSFWGRFDAFKNVCSKYSNKGLDALRSVKEYAKPSKVVAMITVINKKNILSLFTCGKRVSVGRRLTEPMPRQRIQEPSNLRLEDFNSSNGSRSSGLYSEITDNSTNAGNNGNNGNNASNGNNSNNTPQHTDNLYPPLVPQYENSNANNTRYIRNRHVQNNSNIDNDTNLDLLNAAINTTLNKIKF